MSHNYFVSHNYYITIEAHDVKDRMVLELVMHFEHTVLSGLKVPVPIIE
jgi:hypothetical protein